MEMPKGFRRKASFADVSGRPGLVVDNVSLNFGGLTALNAVTFEVAEGEMVGIVGPNGAGKTTLFDVISGVYNPQRGHVFVDGVNITSWSPHRRTQARVARSFQTIGISPGLTVRDNILGTVEARARLRVPYPRRGPTAERRREADDIMSYFDLEKMADRPANELPLGTLKLLELAKVFVGAARFVLLDEPFAGLAQHEAEERAALISKRNKDTNAAVVIVEHDVPLLMKTCTRMIVMNYGNVVAVGPPEEVMTMPEVRRAYLGEVVVGAD